MLIRDEGYGYKPASVVLPRISANSFWDQQPDTIETQRDMPSSTEDNIRYIPGPPGPPGPPGEKGIKLRKLRCNLMLSYRLKENEVLVDPVCLVSMVHPVQKAQLVIVVLMG